MMKIKEKLEELQRALKFHQDIINWVKSQTEPVIAKSLHGVKKQAIKLSKEILLEIEELKRKQRQNRSRL